MSTDREVSSVESSTGAASRQRDHLNLVHRISGLIPALKKVACILALVLFVVLPARAQQTTDEVQKQIEQLKQQYEQTTRELQERIAALEQQLKKEGDSPQNAPKKEVTVSAVEQAVQDAAKVALGQSTDNQAKQGKVPSADVRIPEGC